MYLKVAVVIVGDGCECRSRCEVQGNVEIDLEVLSASSRAIQFMLCKYRKDTGNRPPFEPTQLCREVVSGLFSINGAIEDDVCGEVRTLAPSEIRFVRTCSARPLTNPSITKLHLCKKFLIEHEIDFNKDSNKPAL
jgi:hypothetical protein